MIGQRLLHYEIVEKIGAGGMGVVYKARDTHLDRFVAVKVLPAERVSDPARKARFVQEAKAASALNHPNIITIYDISSDAGCDFIAMEYVAGKTLDELLPRKGMRLAEALRIGVQAADALTRAHSAGIIHRDLKPANIMVDQHGLVKILDFGLAKLTEVSDAPGDETRTAAVRTDEGAIIGTAAYMSPEQAEARPLDARSDIFSFGSVLYEMITGQRAFKGDSRMSALAAVLEKEPAPFDPDIPQQVDRVVRRCLRKEPARRFQTMADLKVALEELKEESDSGVLGAPRVAPAKRRPWALPAIAGALMLAAAVWFWLGRQPAADVPLHAVPLTSYEGGESYASFSPDGNQVAFTWTHPDSAQSGVYVKMIGAEAAQRRTGAKGTFGDHATWSPDGRWLAVLRVVFPRQWVLLVPAIGGAERKIAEVGIPNAITTGVWGPWVAWSRDSQWVIVADRSKGREAALFAISLASGEQKRLTSPLESIIGDTEPAVSPDGRTLAFTRTLSPLVADVYTLALSADLTPKSEPRRMTFDNQWTGGPVWTADGREIIYSAGSPPALWRVRATGSAKPRRLPLGSEEARFPAVSPQGNRLVYSRVTLDTDIWRAPLDSSGDPVRVVSSTLRDEQPRLSRDGSRIAFVSERSGSPEVWAAGADGSNPVQLTSFGGSAVEGPLISPDGAQVAFRSSAGGSWAAYLVSAQGGAPRRLATDPAGVPSSWSRDGKWLYISVRSGAVVNVWKVSPGGGAATQVTKNGGRNAVESADGSFLYYIKGPGINSSLWRVPLAGGEEVKILDGLRDEWAFAGAERGVYHLSIKGAVFGGEAALYLYDLATSTVKPAGLAEPLLSGFDIAPDGRSIYYARIEKQNTDLMLVENFR